MPKLSDEEMARVTEKFNKSALGLKPDVEKFINEAAVFDVIVVFNPKYHKYKNHKQVFSVHKFENAVRVYNICATCKEWKPNIQSIVIYARAENGEKILVPISHVKQCLRNT